MKSITIELAQLRAAMLFAAKRDVRYYLNGVFLEIGAGEFRLASTDGHVLSVQRCEFSTGDAAGMSLIIPDTAIDALKTLKVPSVVLDIDDDGKGGTFRFGATSAGFRAVEGRFPDYRRVIPQETSGKAGQFSAELLMLFHKAAKLLTPRTKFPLYRVEQNGEDPAVVLLEDPRFVGLLMPRRLKGKDNADALTHGYAWSRGAARHPVAEAA